MAIDTPEAVLDAIAPQFASDPQTSDFIALAELRTSQEKFGDKYNLAVALRAAHMMTLRDRKTGEGGSISSKKEGDLGISYATGNGESEDLAQTHYGRQLQRLMKGTITSAGLIGEDNVSSV